MDTTDGIIDFLFSKLNIQVSGASFPQRHHALHCFHPLHRVYVQQPNGRTAPVPAEALLPDDNQRPLLHHRDIVSTWRLPNAQAAYEVFFWEQTFESALARETLLVAIEAFLDLEQHGECNANSIINAFGDYVRGLGTQPVTVTISSLVKDMLEAYTSIISGLAPFSWCKNAEAMVKDFVSSQECFFCGADRAPVVHATFVVYRQHRGELDIGLDFAWNPPLVSLRNFANVVSEGNKLCLRPTTTNIRYHELSPTNVDYFIGPDGDWLRWIEEQGVFEGCIPRTIAARIGAERLESYTIQLDLTARICTRYLGNMVFERIVRCAIPVTVKRKPTTCGQTVGGIASPPIARSNASILTQGTLQHHPLLRSPLKKAHRRLGPPLQPGTGTMRSLPFDEKENADTGLGEVAKLLKLKEERSSGASRLLPPLDALSLARLHDTLVGLELRPPPGPTDFEVRAVSGIVQSPSSTSMHDTDLTWSSGLAPPPNNSPHTTGSASTPRKSQSPITICRLSDQENRSPCDSLLGERDKDTPITVRKRDRTADTHNDRLPQKTGSPGRRHPHEGASDDHTCSMPSRANVLRLSCTSCGQTLLNHPPDGLLECSTCQDGSVSRWMGSLVALDPVAAAAQSNGATNRGDAEANSSRSLTSHEPSRRHEARNEQDWQREIQQNFSDFAAKKRDGEAETLDVTMDDLADSDEELSSSGEDGEPCSD